MQTDKETMMVGLLRTIPVIVLVLCGVVFADISHVPLPLAEEESGVSKKGVAVDWQSIVGTMGVTSVLVWYLWYTTSVTFPKIRYDFREEMEIERKHHREMIDKAFDRIEILCNSLDGLTNEFRTKPCLLGKIPGAEKGTQ